MKFDTDLQTKINGTNTLLVWKTSTYPRPDPARPDYSAWRYLGQRSHLADLNAAARLAVRRMNVTIIDQTVQLEAFGRPDVYLRDDHHVKVIAA